MDQRRRVSLEDYFSEDTMGMAERNYALRSQMQRKESCGEKMRQLATGLLEKGAEHAAVTLGDRINSVTGGFISPADLNRALGRIIPPPVIPNGPPPRDPYRDADFIRISELLKLHGKLEWSLRPRTFALLRMIDAVDAIEVFIAEHLSDFALPYTEENLPNVVKGAASRRQFLDLQNLVLSTHAADLEKGGNHLNFPQSADKHFQSLRELGDGGFGQVDHVWSRLSLRDFARKRIPRGRSFKRDRLAIQNFEKELGNLKLLSHRHLVKLIGSYTDPRWVGLIMHPVADMDLAAYLNADMDPRERKTCLRRFYGCLANAVLYLHQQQIRHKDIKPRNILVKGTNVLITDFGTSRHWTDDSRSTTTGTVPASTPRYCPPEVAGSEERRTSSDIWSLGCCFLEMSTVIESRTIKEMKVFFANNGTQSEFFHANHDATKLWIDLIKKAPEDEDDTEPLTELIPWMLERLAKERPTAQQVVNCILNFEGRYPYYGICCGNEDMTAPTSYNDRSHTDPPPAYVDVVGEGAIKKPSAITVPAVCPLLPSTATPQVEITGSVKRSFIDLGHGKALSTPCVPVPVSRPQEMSAEDRPSIEWKPELSNQGHNNDPAASPRSYVQKLGEVGLSFLNLRKSADPSRLRCQWPRCPSSLVFDGKSNLEKHYRTAHQTHDFSWSRLLSDQAPIRTTPIVGIAERQLNPNLNPPPALKQPNSEITSFLYAAPPTKKANSEIVPIPAISSTINQARRVANFPIPNKRFKLLPEDRRPEPTRAPDEREEKAAKPYQYIAPQNLTFPAIHGKQSTPGQDAIPKSTKAPSYVLANSNRFSASELAVLSPRLHLGFNPRAPPLFVYGSFMFPAIVNAQAKKSMRSIYSPRHQRRVNPGQDDWSRANVSLKHVAEMMTPAVLLGYDRWKPKGLRCAAIAKSRKVYRRAEEYDPSTLKKFRGHVQGFLIFGLSEEALKACDELVPLDACQRSSYRKSKKRESTRSSYNDEDDDSDQEVMIESPYKRQSVEVDIELSDAQIMKLEAFTYVWKSPDLFSDFDGPWGLNDFIKQPCFAKSCEDPPGCYEWTVEEEDLAETMGTVLVLPGEALAHAATEGDGAEVCALLDDGHDINGLCRLYGTALQTAVVHTNEEMVDLLLEEGADVNKACGHYQTALIAAVVSGHDQITMALLRHKADVLADGGRHISALYQAISHSNEEIVYTLLEAGAWLSTGYGELLDLAAERGNEEIIKLLIEYDIRDIHRKLPSYRDRGTRALPRPSSQALSFSSGSVVKAVIGQALMLKGSHGTWQGRKGVMVLRAAIKAGFRLREESHLNLLRSHLTSIPGIIKFFKTTLTVMADPRSVTSDEDQESPRSQARISGPDR